MSARNAESQRLSYSVTNVKNSVQSSPVTGAKPLVSVIKIPGNWSIAASSTSTLSVVAECCFKTAMTPATHSIVPGSSGKS